MQDLILWLIGSVLTVAIATISGLLRLIWGKFKDHERIHVSLFKADQVLDKKIDDHKLHVAEQYTTKVDIRDLKESLVSHLVRIEDKLDKKADKKDA